ncbi:hypothetical protein WM40_05795 [Robbsia andropogonis]|uniref:Uncharacterized protein n=1 Tax=Robbsia andropogonis TaxID=28092 RepID=A0A0F5K2V7_9BURK|nr:hypothetical protein WM40_05795 [Robbsia andropogonis]
MDEHGRATRSAMNETTANMAVVCPARWHDGTAHQRQRLIVGALLPWNRFRHKAKHGPREANGDAEPITPSVA